MKNSLVGSWQEKPELKAGRSNRSVPRSNRIFSRQSLPVPSPSQDRDPEVSGPYEITAKWLRTQVGNSCINTLTRAYMQIYANTRAGIKRQVKSKPNAQICLPSRRGILFLMLLLMSVFPNFCCGACANAHPQSHPNPALYNANLDPHAGILSF